MNVLKLVFVRGICGHRVMLILTCPQGDMHDDPEEGDVEEEEVCQGVGERKVEELVEGKQQG